MKTRWILNAKLFMSSFFTGGYFNLVTSYPEYPGKKFKQLGIGFSVYRWCGNAYLQIVIMLSGDFILTGLGLVINTKLQGVIMPGKKLSLIETVPGGVRKQGLRPSFVVGRR